MVGGEEWCHRDPKVSSAPRGKYSREEEEAEWEKESERRWEDRG